MASFQELYNEAKIRDNRPYYGAYRELTVFEKRELKKLVTSMCATYDRHYKVCSMLGLECPLFNRSHHNGKLCNYFATAVLPLNQELEQSLSDSLGDTKECAICSTPFLPSGRQVYCSDKCSKVGRRKSKAKYMRKNRQENKGSIVEK